MVSGTDVAGDGAASPDRVAAGTDGLVRFAVILVVVLTVIRLAVAGRFDLFFDEAYYWVWSEHLAAGYYDHPPMVAYFIRAGTILFGDTELGVRFFGILAGAADAFLVYGIMQTLTGNRRIAAWAMILMSVTTISAFSVMIVPDQPMMLFWLGAFYGLAKVARGGRPAWWLVVGLMGGLAAASKLTTLFLALAVPLWLAVVPELRVWFRRPWIYAAAAVAFGVFLPVLVWNAQNDWAAFWLQYNRPQFDDASIVSFLTYLGIVPLMIGPVAVVFVVAGIRASLRGGRIWRRPATALLFIAPLPLVLYLGIHSFGETIGVHWVAPIVAVGAMLGAIGIEDLRGRPSRWPRIVVACRKAIVPVGVFVSVVFYALILESFLPIPREYDWTERFSGWEEFASRVEEARVDTGSDYILAPTYSIYALLRFYSDPEALIYPLADRARWDTFGDFALMSPDAQSQRALYVGEWGRFHTMNVLATYFATYEQIGRIDRERRPGSVDRKWIFTAENPLAAALPLYSRGSP
ncbi:MAG: glycosyltransferase family 39 protein [Bauldia sp.]|nr:glycosyltransferase family 39 protein [Bauldia sp.]